MHRAHTLACTKHICTHTSHTCTEHSCTGTCTKHTAHIRLQCLWSCILSICCSPGQALSSGESSTGFQLVVEEFAFNDSVAPRWGGLRLVVCGCFKLHTVHPHLYCMRSPPLLLTARPHSAIEQQHCIRLLCCVQFLCRLPSAPVEGGGAGGVAFY